MVVTYSGLGLKFEAFNNLGVILPVCNVAPFSDPEYHTSKSVVRGLAAAVRAKDAVYMPVSS